MPIVGPVATGTRLAASHLCWSQGYAVGRPVSVPQVRILPRAHLLPGPTPGVSASRCLRGAVGCRRARPDGRLSATVSARPVRVQRKDGSWVAVDPTLRRTAGGLVPTAAAVDLTFAAGGGTTLATVVVQGKSLAMSWPSVLPAPTVSGATATYAEVLPGLDLRLMADVEGFEEELVVRTAAAAANPALRTIRFGLVTTGGLTVQAGADGALSAVDTAGGTVLRSAQQPVDLVLRRARPADGVKRPGQGRDDPGLRRRRAAVLGDRRPWDHAGLHLRFVGSAGRRVSGLDQRDPVGQLGL